MRALSVSAMLDTSASLALARGRWTAPRGRRRRPCQGRDRAPRSAPSADVPRLQADTAAACAPPRRTRQQPKDEAIEHGQNAHRSFPPTARDRHSVAQRSAPPCQRRRRGKRAGRRRQCAGCAADAQRPRAAASRCRRRPCRCRRARTAPPVATAARPTTPTETTKTAAAHGEPRRQTAPSRADADRAPRRRDAPRASVTNGYDA